MTLVTAAAVPWARHQSGHTLFVDDQVADLTRIGIDEISYKRGHKYLTCVVDHDSGRHVWAAPGPDKATLATFFDALGPERSAQITYVSADGATWRQCCRGASDHRDPPHDPHRLRLQITRRPHRSRDAQPRRVQTRVPRPGLTHGRIRRAQFRSAICSLSSCPRHFPYSSADTLLHALFRTARTNHNRSGAVLHGDPIENRCPSTVGQRHLAAIFRSEEPEG